MFSLRDKSTIILANNLVGNGMKGAGIVGMRAMGWGEAWTGTI